MSELRTLHQRLDQLVHHSVTSSDGERALVEDGERSLLQAMHAEITETQLPRKLVFRNDQDASIAFEVSAGRVLSCYATADASDTETVLVAAQDTAAISKAVSAFCDGARKLRVRAIRLDKPQGALDFGVAADTIFMLCPDTGGTREIETTPTSLEHFFQASKALSPGSLLLRRGDVADEHGSAEILSRLHRLMETEHLRNMAALAVQGDQDTGSQCAIYAGYPSETHGLMCVFQAGILGLITYRADALGKIVALWQSYTS